MTQEIQDTLNHMVNISLDNAGTLKGHEAHFELSWLLEDLLADAQKTGDKQGVADLRYFNRLYCINCW